jgi:hypothetical protein
MDFATVVRVLLRHWLVLLIGFALAVGGALAAYRSAPRSYEASSQVMLLLRPTASNPELETSPFLYLPDGLTALARVVTLIPNTPEYRASMAEEGFEPAYSVELQARDPIVIFTVEGPEAESVLRTRDELMTRFAEDLDRVQTEEGVPDRQWAHFRVLQASDVPAAQAGGAFQRAAAVAALIGLLTLGTIALLERRSRRRAAAPEGHSADGLTDLGSGEPDHSEPDVPEPVVPKPDGSEHDLPDRDRGPVGSRPLTGHPVSVPED